ncbi:MAG: hypothetical protein MUF34_16850 [Polyangiaceae bacterium]|jgi:hypothetical protein|nr:hypothetical protein [Polyangiaceae bacterium]
MSETLDIPELVRKHGLKPAGKSINTEYFELDDGVLLVVPFEGSRDDGRSARSNAELQTKFFRERGRKGAVIIFFDRMKSQDREARTIYADMDAALTATALVGGSMLTRAMASFLLGIARPKVPIKLFSTFEAALEWAREMNRTAARAFDGGA